MPLGCTVGYQAHFISKEGVPLSALIPQEVQWGRNIDGYSEAEIRVQLAGDDCEPCEIVKLLNVIHHHLVLIRDGEYVWEGVIVNIVWSRTECVILARDVLWIAMVKRILHDPHCFALACGGVATELADIAEILLADLFEVDGHRYQFEKYNDTFPTLGRLGERLYQPGERGEEVLEELFNLGLDVTVLGTKIIVGAAPFGRLATLTSADFLVDLEVEQDGMEAATRAVTIGDKFVGVATAPGTDINGEDAYYGLLEYVDRDRPELNTQVQADDAAQALVNSKFPPPVVVSTPNGATLSPNAPVEINELVPGVGVTIITQDTCREAAGDFILTEVQVTWDSETQAETVGTSFATLVTLNSGHI